MNDKYRIVEKGNGYFYIQECCLGNWFDITYSGSVIRFSNKDSVQSEMDSIIKEIKDSKIVKIHTVYNEEGEIMND